MSPVWVLVGPPGAGKSTVGERLATRLGVGYRDTDADVESVAGQPIADIFVEHGEEHFRDLESAAVLRALNEHDGVLSLGGGAVLRERNREALAGHRVVYLEVSLPEATRRVGMNTARPLLLGNVRARLKLLLDERRPLYRAVAETTVTTDGLDPDAVVDAIVGQAHGARS